MSKFYPEYFQDFENMKKKKAGKQTKQSSKTVFRNSRQNRKAIKIDRDTAPTIHQYQMSTNTM